MASTYSDRIEEWRGYPDTESCSSQLLNIEMMEEINSYLSSLMAEKGFEALSSRPQQGYSVGVEVPTTSVIWQPR